MTNNKDKVETTELKTTPIQDVKTPEKLTFTRYCPVLNLVIKVDGGLYEREEKCSELIEKRDKGEDITKQVIYS